MGKFLKYSGILIFLILVVLFLLPFLMPIDKYKNNIISQIKNSINRDLSINGKISFSILPKLSVKLEQIKLSSIEGASASYLLEIEKAQATIALLPLLKGDVIISTILLEKPKINLEKLKDGRVSWEFDTPTLKDSSSTSKNNEANQHSSTNLPFFVQHVKINNSKINYIVGNDKTNIENLNVDLTMNNIKGPLNFVLEFQMLAENVEVTGNINEIGSILPIVAKIKALGGELDVNGKLNITGLTFNGEINNNGNFKNFFQIQLPKGLTQDYKLFANIKADKENANIENLSFNCGNIDAKGNLNYSFSKKDLSINFNIMPGDINIQIAPIKEQDLLSSKISIQSNNIKTFLSALEIDTKEFPEEIITKTMSFNGNIQYKNDDFSINNMKFTLGKADLNGHINIQDGATKPTLSYELRSTNGEAIINLFKSKLPPFHIGNINIKGKTTKNNELLQTDTTITAAGAALIVSGEVNFSTDATSLLSINLSGSNLGQTINQLFKQSSANSLRAFSIISKLEGNLQKNINFTIEKSNINLLGNPINFQGKGNFSLDREVPQLSSDIQITKINLDNFISSPTPSSPNSISANVKNQPRWSHNKIDLSSLNSFNGIINLSLQSLVQGSLTYDNIKSVIELKNGVLSLNSLTANAYGGKLEASGNLSDKKPNPLHFKAALISAKLKNIPIKNQKFTITQGDIDGNINLTSKGDSIYQYINNLNGSVALKGQDGVINGINLQTVVNTLNNAKNLAQVLAIMDKSIFSGETSFKTLEADLAIEKGVGQITKCNLISNEASANATGKIDLPKYILDIIGTINVEVKNMPPFKAHLFGAIDSMQYKLDTSALQKYLVNNVLTNVIDDIKSGKTKPKDILKDIIGGRKDTTSQSNTDASQDNIQDQTTESTEPQAQTTKSPSVDNILEEGLKGLLK